MLTRSVACEPRRSALRLESGWLRLLSEACAAPLFAARRCGRGHVFTPYRETRKWRARFFYALLVIAGLAVVRISQFGEKTAA